MEFGENKVVEIWRQGVEEGLKGVTETQQNRFSGTINMCNGGCGLAAQGYIYMDTCMISWWGAGLSFELAGGTIFFSDLEARPASNSPHLGDACAKAQGVSTSFFLARALLAPCRSKVDGPIRETPPMGSFILLTSESHPVD